MALYWIIYHMGLVGRQVFADAPQAQMAGHASLTTPYAWALVVREDGRMIWSYNDGVEHRYHYVTGLELWCGDKQEITPTECNGSYWYCTGCGGHIANVIPELEMHARMEVC